MSCRYCDHLHDIPDLGYPYVVRTCEKCGRKINLRELGDNGHGIKVEKGDQFVLPKGWLQLAANPLKGTGHLTRYGLAWFAKLIFIEEIKSENEIDEILEDNKRYADSVLMESKLVFKRLKGNDVSAEWWALLVGTFGSGVKYAIANNDAKKAAWAMRAAERCRAMCVFKNHLEEVVWMGHSAGRIVEVLKKWYANTGNSLEEFWQQLFNDNPYVLTQLFSVPVVFIRDKAYVGGMNIDRQDAKFVDYLYANDSSNDALLVELKTPVTKLLGSKYRKGVYKPSSELTGAIVQTLDYRREIASNIRSITEGTDKKLEIFNPRCIVVAGDATIELNDDLKRKSFELFRTSLKDVEVVTYDELFKKAETLASLFNLVAKRN